jgi:hypothetical protein
MVVLHDVAPPFAESLLRITDALTDLIGTRFACAVVPRWHGKLDYLGESEFWTALRHCDEILLHGWTHQRTHRPGWLSKITNRADEFGGLSLAAIQDRLDRSQTDLQRKLGVHVTGLVPPAWQLPVPSHELQHLTHVMRWNRLESLSGNKPVYPLATWSFDWGCIPISKHASHLLALAMQKRWPNATPCIVIHPLDVQRGQFTYIVKRIRQMMDTGHEPTTPTEFLKLVARQDAVTQ